MKHDLIKIPANHGGFTDVFTLTHADLVAVAADGVLEAITLDAFKVGDRVFDALIEITAEWSGAGVDTLTVSLGTTVAAPTEIIGASALIATTPVAEPVKTAYAPANTFAGLSVDPPTDLILYAGFDADAAAKPSETTAGELLIWMNLSRWADRVGNRQLG